MPEPITDDHLRVLEALADEHVVGQALPITPTPQGMAVAQLVRSVPSLLHEIAMSRQSEAHDQGDYSYSLLEGWSGLAARLRAKVAHELEVTDKAIARAEKAEAAVERVRRLANLARYKGPEPADTHAAVLDSLARELLEALDGE